MLEGIGARHYPVDVEPGLAEPLLQVSTGFRFIFGYQKFHAVLLTLRDAMSVQRIDHANQKLTEM
ncbi:hypothetical protein D3C84_1037250 [compost metagenome]